MGHRESRSSSIRLCQVLKVENKLPRLRTAVEWPKSVHPSLTRCKVPPLWWVESRLGRWVRSWKMNHLQIKSYPPRTVREAHNSKTALWVRQVPRVHPKHQLRNKKVLSLNLLQFRASTSLHWCKAKTSQSLSQIRLDTIATQAEPATAPTLTLTEARQRTTDTYARTVQKKIW